MSGMHKVYKATITTLTPLHIGTGTRLLKDYDYVSRGGKTWVINNDALARELGDIEDPTGLRHLSDADYVEDGPFFRYVLDGEVNAKEPSSELQEAIKDPWDYPYIPGSSFKGALRTGLAIHLWGEKRPQYKELMRQKKADSAGQIMENDVFRGKEADPRFSLMRLVRVTDSMAVAPSNLLVCPVSVFSGSKPQSPVRLEAIKSNVQFETQIVIDGFLSQGIASATLGFTEAQLIAILNLEHQLPGIMNRILRERFEVDQRFWQSVEQSGLANYANSRIQDIDKCAPNEFLVQLGWGGGWDNKTFNTVLKADPEAFAALVNHPPFRMMRKDKYTGKPLTYKQGAWYPKSRRLMVDANNKPLRPLGLVKVRLEARP